MKFLSDILAKAGLTVDGVVTLNNTATGQTPSANDNSTKLATTAWVRTFVQPYNLPIATASILGGIKVGSGLSIDSITGVLSAVSAGAASIKSTQTFIATAGQTVFTISGGYTSGLIDVFLNGVYLSPNQTTATNGTTVTLGEAAAVGDIVDVIIASAIYQGATTTTDQLPEGSTNLYFTNARARTAISLTVTGTSGASTYNSTTGVLNVPTYTLTGLGGVSTSRTLTINGVAYDLSADRTWSIASGGLTGQILIKNSDSNFDYAWTDNYADWTSQLKHTVKADVAITKGQAVYVSSADGTNMIVSKASNAAEGTSSKTLGLIAQNLSVNGQGFVITEGLLAGLNTATANAGDPVWLGTDGNLIYGLLNKPVAPAHLVFIGVVTRSNANNGEIFVKVQNGFELDELHDLSVKNASDGDMIKYVASTGLWTKIAASTTNITEGTNLYYTQGRFDTAFAAKSTTNLSEGTNLYFTTARARTSISVTGSGSYDSATGVITVTGGVTSVNTLTGAVTLTTTNIGEGTNLYYTTTRVNTDFDTRLATKSTTNLAEGTNLYYTDGRVGTYLTANSYATQSYVSTQINNLVSGAPGLLDTLDELAAALGDDPNFATTISTALSNRLRIDTASQGLTSTQQGYGRTNLGLGSLAVLSSVGNAQITDLTYSKLTGVPSTFAPSSHTHPISDITGLQTALDGKQASLSGTGFVKISGTTISYDNNTYALDSAVVHLSGTESISGQKTFTAKAIFNLTGYDAILLSGGGVFNTNAIGIFNNNYPSADATKIFAHFGGNWASAGNWGIGIRGQNDSTVYLSQSSGGNIDITKTDFELQLGAYKAVKNNRTLTINGTAYDLSVDRSWSVGTVTSIGLSSATSGITIGSTPITTSGTITLAIATASGSQQGLLSSTDWNTFNNKQNALTNPVTGTGTTNYVTKWTSSSAVGNSQIFDNGTNVGIGTTSPALKLDIRGTSASSVLDLLKVQNESSAASSGSGILLKGYYNAARIVGVTQDASFDYSAYLAFQVNNPSNVMTERMRITSGGNVGIGTTSPSYTLDVNGTGRFSGSVIIGAGSSATSQLDVTSNAGANGITLRNRNGDDYAFFNWRNYSGTELLGEFYMQRTAANTGVLRYTIANGSSPATYLTIAASGAATFSSTVSSAGLLLPYSTYTRAIYTNASGYLNFTNEVNTGSHLIIGTDGSLTVGSTKGTGAYPLYAGVTTLTGNLTFSTQGSKIIFGDSTSSSPMMIGEGLVDTEGTDSDFMTLYFRTSFRVFSQTQEMGRFTNTGLRVYGTIIKDGGTSSQFLKADGSVDSSTYLTTSSASSTYLPLTGGTLSGILYGNGGGNFYIYNYARIGSPNGGKILYNNGTGANMFFGEIAADVYGFTGNLYSDIPTLAMNVSSRKVTINGSSPSGVLTVQSSADGNMFSIRGFLSGYSYPNLIEMGVIGADGYFNIKDGAGNIQTSLSGYTGTSSYFLTKVLIGTNTNIAGGPYGILTARQTTAGTPAIVASVENASSTNDGTILLGNLTTASSAYRLISGYSGNGSTDNFSVNQFYVRGDGYAYFKQSVNTALYRIAPNSTANVYNIVDSDYTYAGAYSLQAGGGSTGYGGSLVMYGHSHASRAGYVTAGISAGSGGKFTVMNGGNGSGSDVFTVSSNGNVSVSGLLYADGGINLGSYAKFRWSNNNTPTLGLPFGDFGTAIHIEVSDNDTGGLVISNDGTTVYGAGDQGFVFRVIDEDSYQGGGGVEANTCFKVNQGAGGGGYMRGDFTATGDIIAYSDIRVKENIKPLTDALSKVIQLNGYYYNRTDLKDKSTKVGFIAQEVEKIIPELVTYDSLLDRYAVSYGNTTALLVEAIKELKAENDLLKERLEILENK